MEWRFNCNYDSNNTNKFLDNMAHENVWYSHPRKYGKGSRAWYVS